MACTAPGKSWWGRGLQALRLAGPAVGRVLLVPLPSTALAPTRLLSTPTASGGPSFQKWVCAEELLAWCWPSKPLVHGGLNLSSMAKWAQTLYHMNSTAFPKDGCLACLALAWPGGGVSLDDMGGPDSSIAWEGRGQGMGVGLLAQPVV